MNCSRNLLIKVIVHLHDFTDSQPITLSSSLSQIQELLPLSLSWHKNLSIIIYMIVKRIDPLHVMTYGKCAEFTTTVNFLLFDRWNTSFHRKISNLLCYILRTMSNVSTKLELIIWLQIYSFNKLQFLNWIDPCDLCQHQALST